MLNHSGGLRNAAVLGASAFVLVAACDRDGGEAARGELGAAELSSAGPGGPGGSPGGQAGAPLASPDFKSGGAGDGEGGSPALGEGGSPALGGGGVGGIEDEPAPTCDRVADLVPITCPLAGPVGPYRETGLGFLELTGWHPYQSPWPTMSEAQAINASGDVVGFASLCDTTRAVLYRGGVLLELDPIPGAIRSAARDINDEGDVLGDADGAVFVWKNSVTTVLSGIGHGYGIAINNLGQVLGEDEEGTYIWDAGLVTRLELERGMRATDLNDRGQVTGYDVHAHVGLSAFVWEDGVSTLLPPLLSDDNFTTARAINEAGQVVGSSGKYQVGRAVLWDSGIPFDITPPTDYLLLDSSGVDINESSVVLGYFQEDGAPQHSTAFVFDHGVTTRIFPADPSFAASLSPRAINDAGQITGTTASWVGLPMQATVWSRECFGACCQ
jgi:uncharacterized membrane protein